MPVTPVVCFLNLVLLWELGDQPLRLTHVERHAVQRACENDASHTPGLLSRYPRASMPPMSAGTVEGTVSLARGLSLGTERQDV